ncbi:MAG: hypothetical protein ACOCZ6_06165 [Nanoarchaeota archaeon]
MGYELIDTYLGMRDNYRVLFSASVGINDVARELSGISNGAEKMYVQLEGCLKKAILIKRSLNT